MLNSYHDLLVHFLLDQPNSDLLDWGETRCKTEDFKLLLPTTKVKQK